MVKIDKSEFYKVQMAAILHDIGKFWQRTGKSHHDEYNRLTKNDFGHIGAHSKWSASFIKDIGLDKFVEELALYHHKPSSLSERDKFLTHLISKADQYSCKERIDLGYAVDDVRKEPLISVFSNLKLSNNNNSQEYYYPLKKLGLKDLVVPVESKKKAIGGWSLQHNYKDLWNEFLKEAKLISNANFGELYYLLKKYTSFMPSAAYKDYPDIALFDHLKTTAAIASCIYIHITEKGENLPPISDKTKYFTLISGDISGIQNFIFDIASPQFAQKGMAKRLRGRSFYVNLLNENLSRMIIERLELNDTNILWCGGGNFLIIAPNTKETENVLREFDNEINNILFKKYGGKLFFSLVYKNVSGLDLDNFAELKENIFFENSRNKRQKYLRNLDMIFKEEEYIPSNICKICGSASDKDICKECKIHEDLGDKITNAEYIIRAVLKDSVKDSVKDSLKNSDYGKFDFQDFNVGFSLLKKNNNSELLEEIERISKLTSKIQVFKLNSTDFLNADIIKKLEEKNQNIQVTFGFSFIANTVPKHEKYGLLNFENIAKISKGTKKLGILKMDIDNLRKLFEVGLRDTVSISRTSTMSSLLDIFISGYINDLVNEYYILPDICANCKDKVDIIEFEDYIIYREKEIKGKIERVCEECAKKKIPMLYTGFSAGDDILIIGPWDIIIRFSQDTREKFKRYTCMNKDINMSAGIFICNSKFPMSRAINIVDDILDKSKLSDIYKDKISVFGETVRWKSFDQFKGYDELIQFADQLELLTETDKISRGFVYSLLMLSNNSFDDLEGKELEDKIKARSERKRYVPTLKYKLTKVKELEIRKYLNRILIDERMLPWIKIPASVTILRWRNK